MVLLSKPKEFQGVGKLAFCYLCGKPFAVGDETNRDHIPPKGTFHVRDKEPPLILKTHTKCNNEHSENDKKIGQLIAMRRWEKPKMPRDRALSIVHFARNNMAAVDNLHIDKTVWRWVIGFHAALYREPLIGTMISLQTPFPRAEKVNNEIILRPLLPQHLLVVEHIKLNRLHNNLDRIVSNKGKMTYECVWCQADDQRRWLCMFALDIYDWKDLGSHTKDIPARGCVGIYMLQDGSMPKGATMNRKSNIIIPNYDVLDAFAP